MLRWITLEPRQEQRHQLRATLPGCLCLIFALWAGSLPAAEGEQLKRASLMPMWSPQAQFAGYYVALDQGFYRRHGIDLQLLRAGPGNSPLDALRQGEADFAVLWLITAMRHSALEGDLIQLAQMVQRSSLLLVTRSDNEIDSLAAMAGRRVGLWGGELSLPIEVLLAREGVAVEPVRQSMTINLFLQGGIDVASATSYNEYHALINAGVNADELRVFALADLDLNVPEDGLYMLESRFRADPALARAFVAASLEGWRYAFAHPEEALDIVIRHMKEARLPANRVHQRWMLARMEELMQPQGEAPWASLRRQDYQAAAALLRQAGMAATFAPYAQFAGAGSVAVQDKEPNGAGSAEK